MSDAIKVMHLGGRKPDGIYWHPMRRDGRVEPHLVQRWEWAGLQELPADIVSYIIAADDVADGLVEKASFSAALAQACGAPAAPFNRATVLDAARDAVLRDRAATHGDVEDSFAKIAAVWSAMVGVAISPTQVAIMLGQLKDVRAWTNPGHMDNWVDKAGYAACGGELAAKAEARAHDAV